jgi:hypothetical protein
LLHLSAANSTAFSSADFDQTYNFLRIVNTTNDKAAGIYFGIGTNGEAAITAAETSDGETALVFGTRGGGARSERARLTHDGKLLVGTSSEISSISPSIQMARSDGAFMAFGRDDTSITDDELLGASYFYGKQGGTWSLSALIAARADAAWGSNDYPSKLVLSTTADGASSPTERMRISSDGSVGIGNPGNTTNSSQDVDFRCFVYSPSGSTSSQIFIDSRKADAFININQSYGDTVNRSAVLFARNESGVGSISISSAQVFYNTTSDYRLKENIVDVVNGIDLVKQLQPREFNFISEPDETIAGFIAHEVEAVIPNAIFGEKDAINDEGDPVYQSIDQSKLVPILTAALKEAITKIETLEAKVAALEAA